LKKSITEVLSSQQPLKKELLQLVVYIFFRFTSFKAMNEATIESLQAKCKATEMGTNMSQ